MSYNPKKLKYAGSVIPSLSIEEAKQLQFKLVDSMSRHFTGEEFLSLGDLGVAPRYKQPEQTKRAELMLADFFGTEDTALVRGAGTGAIQILLSTLMTQGDSMFIHQAPVYTTTAETIRMLGLNTNIVDYNNLNAVEKALARDDNSKIFYIQHARQQPFDHYNLKELIQTVKNNRSDLLVVVDDNYSVMKSYGIGAEYGADYSTFSGFKILGPEGIGIITGKNEAIDIIRKKNYSGGGQVQGHEAMELIRMMTFAPVTLAIQSKQVEEVCKRLNEGAVSGISNAYIVNAQSKVIIVELEKPIAQEVIQRSNTFGAATHPIGAESKYEMIPMIYRVSGTFSAAEPHLKEYGIRINPMKAGALTVLRILEKAIQSVELSM